MQENIRSYMYIQEGQHKDMYILDIRTYMYIVYTLQHFDAVVLFQRANEQKNN